jgi:hypothetical protein
VNANAYLAIIEYSLSLEANSFRLTVHPVPSASSFGIYFQLDGKGAPRRGSMSQSSPSASDSDDEDPHGRLFNFEEDAILGASEVPGINDLSSPSDHQPQEADSDSECVYCLLPPFRDPS